MLVQLLGTVASEPFASVAGLGLKQVSLPTVMLGVGLIFLVTLTISRFTPKFGLPAILGVLLFGLLLPAHLNPLSVERISHLQTVNLAMLLFYAGLSTDLRQIRSFLGYGLLLSIGGVVVTTLVLGMCIWFLSSPTASSVQLGTSQIPLVVGMLVASCLASTDAGATLSVLKQVRHHVPEKLRDLLEFESALNDPAAILMLSLMLGLASLSGAQRAEGVLVDQLRLFIQALGSGVLVGVLVGFLARFTINRIVTDASQLLVLGLSIALIGFGLAQELLGSGFIATYVAGLVLANHDYSNRWIKPEALQQALLPFNTMTEIAVFFLFGLAMSPAKIWHSLSMGILVSLAMILVARPLGVLAFQRFSPFNARESVLVAWCGLRGAVPLALTHDLVVKLPEIRGLTASQIQTLGPSIEGIISLAVVLNLLIQGVSLPLLCRRLGLGSDEPALP